MTNSSFRIAPEIILKLFESLIPACNNTGQDKLPSFGNEFSLISPTKKHKLNSRYSFLCIDVGGTRSKACLKIKNSSEPESWIELIDIDNNDFNLKSSGKGLCLMTTELGKNIALAIKKASLDMHFDGVAVVWSNKIQSFQLNGKSTGVGAKVFGSKDGQAYRKGEWWNSDIQDGDDISAYFDAGLRASGIEFDTLVISNDTVFTAKAISGAYAGVVASTGANATILAVDKVQFYNSECGGKIKICKELLKLQQLEAKLPATDIEIKIEDVCAGRGLPQIFTLLIQDLVASGEEELRDFSEKLRATLVTAPDLGKVISANSFAVLAEKDLAIKNGEELALSTLKDAIFNAGAFCTVLIFVSVANQLKSGDSLLVALDSSQARHMPGYKESLDQHLGFLNSKLSANVSYELLQPNGKISVPLQGAALTLEDFKPAS